MSLYDFVASLRVQDVAMHLDNKASCVTQINKRNAVRNMASYNAWKQTYIQYVRCEALACIHKVLYEEGKPEYECQLTKKNGDEWVLEHFRKINGQQMGSTVFALKFGDEKDYTWLGVFHNHEKTTLNPKLKEKFRENETLKVWVKLLVAITSETRMHEACCTVDVVPVFSDYLMGKVTEDFAISDEASSISTGQSQNGLNDSQNEALETWASGVKFMMLHGPPGTGKTTTAVEILKRSLSNKRKGKIVCAAPSWTAVYEYASRFMRGNSNAKAVLTGCNDRTRTAAQEPEDVRNISVASFVRSVHDWLDSPDRSGKKYTHLIDRIKKRAPEFFRKELENTRSGSIKDKAHDLYDLLPGIRSALLREADVVFATLNALGSSQIAETLSDVEMLIIDEAGQVADPDLFIGCALNPRRLLLIGDHKQLPATVLSEQGKRSGLGYSSLERLCGDRTQWQKMLKVQYRMAPEILKWPNGKFYNGCLEDHRSWKRDKKWDGRRYRVINVGYGEELKVGTSFQNCAEGACVVRTVLDFKEAGVDFKDMLVITPYKVQKHLLYKYLKNFFQTSDLGELPAVSTIDSCQGAERAHVVLSLVRTDPESSFNFATEPKHLCVAMTRAMQTMTVICNSDTAPKDGCMRDLVNDARHRGVLKDFETPVEYEGIVVGAYFIADKGGLRTRIRDLGRRVIHGDRVSLRLLEKDRIVVDVEVLAESPFRKEEFECQLVSDSNVCFEAPTRELRESILRNVREIAAKAEGVSCNGCGVDVCDRQPVNENYFTLTVPDLLAKDLLSEKQEVHVTDHNGEKLKVPVCIPQEPFYHKLIPLDERVPTLFATAEHVLRHKLTYNTTVTVQLILDDSAPAGDEWYARIVKKSSKSFTKQWLRCLTDDKAEQDEMLAQLNQKKNPGATPRVSGPPVSEGQVFTLDTVGTEMHDDALSCERREEGGWHVSLHIADPTDMLTDDDLHTARRRSRDICLVDGRVNRMMPERVVREASFSDKEPHIHRACYTVAFTVAQDGRVLATTFTSGSVQVTRNFVVSPEMEWTAFEKVKPGEGPQFLKEAVDAMMQKERFFEEATRIQNAFGGPMHIVQYLAIRAKRAAARKLGKACNGHVLFTNMIPPVKEAANMLKLEESITETELCRSIQCRVKAAKTSDSKLHVRALLAVVRDLVSYDDRHTYIEGCSTVSFTSPLRKYGDLAVLKLLKDGIPKKAVSTAELHMLKLDEGRKLRCAKEIFDKHAGHKYEDGPVVVTDIKEDKMRVYCPATDGLVRVPTVKGATPWKMLNALMVKGPRGTYVRERVCCLVPYKGDDGYRIVQRKTVQAPRKQGGGGEAKPTWFGVEVHFAGVAKKATTLCSLEKVNEAISRLLPRVKYLYIAKDTRLRGNGWFIRPMVTCTTCERTPRTNCTYYHGRENPAEEYTTNKAAIYAAAKKASEELGCSINCY
eukprot:TRINITY_DN119_c0_g1_i2.p1 TRINITY_DN119_c0_g1~~TRINITY_DN119_c0_g1_i2.p1  ORF type:complete len:1441 (+),score=452.28 TRINITY_DN119_c0_g1_i2:1676-5998(+)